MISFYRKIRKKLAAENEFVKYSRYAIGEILLVVIGILIALQVNNWNETRKLKQTEIKLLSEVANDLSETLNELDNDINWHRIYLKSGNTLIEAIKTKTLVTDSAGYLFSNIIGDLQLYPKTSGYNLLESKGMDIISNDSLRMDITNIYELGIKRIVEAGKLNPYYDIGKDLLPYETKHFIQTNETYTAVLPSGIKDSIRLYRYEPKSMDDLLNDSSFLIELQNSIQKRLDKIQKHETAISKIEQLINDISKELEKL